MKINTKQCFCLFLLFLLSKIIVKKTIFLKTPVCLKNKIWFDLLFTFSLKSLVYLQNIVCFVICLHLSNKQINKVPVCFIGPFPLVPIVHKIAKHLFTFVFAPQPWLWKRKKMQQAD